MSDLDNKQVPGRRPHNLTAEDRAAMLSQLEFGSRLSKQLVARIAASSTVVEARRRRFIYKAAEQADSLYAIVKGRIKLCRIEASTAREAVIDILPQGSLFGDSALYSTRGRPRELCSSL